MSVRIWSDVHSQFSDTEVKKYASSEAGVYALWVNYKSGRWGCFYVGKAVNIEDRLLKHLRDDEPNPCIKKNVNYICAFCWIEITTERERSGAEKYLYDKMKPECNTKDPGGTSLSIPLPPKPEPTQSTL